MRPTELDLLLNTLAAVFRAEGRAAANDTARALLNGPAHAGFACRAPCLFDAGIRAVLAGSLHPAAQAALLAQARLPWGTNPVASSMTPDAAAICAVAEILGPDAPIHASDLRVGFLYQRPESYYPLHNHDADETYLVLAGQALWTAGADMRSRGAGAMIHHPSLMPHAFRTGPEGMVALYRWSGDINAESYTFLDDPALG